MNSVIRKILGFSSESERQGYLDRLVKRLDGKLVSEIESAIDSMRRNKPQDALTLVYAYRYLADQSGKKQLIAGSLFWQGTVATMMADYERAVSTLEQAYQHFSELGYQPDVDRTLMALISPLMYLGRYEQAMTISDDLADNFEQKGDEAGLARLLTRRANLRLFKGELTDAHNDYLRASELFNRLGMEDDLAINETNRAVCLNDLGYYQDAQKALFTAKKVFKARKEKLNVAAVDLALATTYINRGKYLQGIKKVDHLIDTYKKHGLKRELAVAMQTKAEALIALNDHSGAARFLNKLVILYEDLGIKLELNQCRLSLARINAFKGDYDQALELLAKTEEYAGDAGDITLLCSAIIQRLQLLLKMKQLDKAEKAAEELQRLPQIDESPWRKCLMLITLGELAGIRGHYKEQAEFTNAALDIAREHRFVELEFRAIRLQATQHASFGQKKKAIKLYLKALKAIDHLRLSLAPAQWAAIGYLEDKIQLFEEAINLCIEVGDEEHLLSALRLVEGARSAVFIERIANRLEIKARSLSSSQKRLIKEYNMVAERLSALYKELRGYHKTRGQYYAPIDTDINEQLQALSERFEHLSARMQQELYPLRAKESSKTRSLNIKGIMASLADDEALCEYYKVMGRLLSFVLTVDSVRVIDIGNYETIRRECAEFHNQELLLFEAQPKLFKENSQQLLISTNWWLNRLYHLVMEPVMALLGDKSMVFIVPYGVLHSLNYGLLRDTQGYIGDRIAFRYLPTGQLLLHRSTMNIDSIFKDTLLAGIEDHRFPGIQKEVYYLAELIPGAQIALKDQSSALSARMKGKSLVHIASHAILDSQKPYLSHIQLNDSALFLGDIASLHLSAQLVTLSACQTGSAAPLSGDELEGFIRGFLMAGGSNILASSWKVDDDATALLMEKFYNGIILNSNSVEDSLKYAQIQVREKYNHPFLWGAFRLFGV